MKILAFAASNSVESINRNLVTYSTKRLAAMRNDLAITHLNIADFDLPIYSGALERASGIPQAAQDFRGHIEAADAIIASFPEHNGSVPAVWKNLFDWMSRMEGKVWQGKLLIALSATPGGRAGAGVLGYVTMTAPHMGADLRGHLGIGNWGKVWDGDKLIDQAQIEALDAVLSKLV